MIVPNFICSAMEHSPRKQSASSSPGRSQSSPPRKRSSSNTSAAVGRSLSSSPTRDQPRTVQSDTHTGPAQELPRTHVPHTSSSEIVLPQGWENQVREKDKRWMSQLFHKIIPEKEKKKKEKKKNNDEGERKDPVSLKDEYHHCQWIYPPAPRSTFSKMPKPGQFWTIPLCLWAPYLRWKYQFYCVNSNSELGCYQTKPMTRCG